MINIPALYKAWQAGEIITNPEKWKSGAELASAATLFVSSTVIMLSYWYPSIVDWMSEDVQVYLSAAIVNALCFAQIIIARITTKKKVGLDVLIEK